MEYDKSFLREYSLDVARTADGNSQLAYKIEGKFFEHFEKSQVQKGEVDITLDIEKNRSHLDATFHLNGWVELNCDRCGQPYEQPIENEFRIIFSFKETETKEEDEVVFVERNEDQLSLIQEFYDFIHLSLPMRKVPEPDIHLCDPEVLKLLGLDENGDPLPENEDEKEVDPRWAALKQLKDKFD
ncbi:MAG: DUF177 domain-containing protein [Bacteroidota bacterium]